MNAIKNLLLNLLIIGSFASNALAQVGVAANEKLPDTSNDPYLKELISGLKVAKKNFKDIPVRSGRSSIITNLKISDPKEAKRISGYAGAAYCTDLTLNLWNCNHCKALGSGIKVNAIFSELLTGSRGFIATDQGRKQIILSFRGTSNIRNALVDLNLALVVHNINGASPDIKVHAGFKNALNGLSPQFTPVIKDLLSKYPDYKFIVAGHSLGGAIATLATIELQQRLSLSWNRIQLFTYGAPRIGNLPFAEWLNRQNLTLTRVVNNKDIVPHLPPRSVSYSQNQREMFLENGTSKVCSINVLEDPTCALSKEPFLSIADHLTYYNGFLGGVC